LILGGLLPRKGTGWEKGEDRGKEGKGKKGGKRRGKGKVREEEEKKRGPLIMRCLATPLVGAL